MVSGAQTPRKSIDSVTHGLPFVFTNVDNMLVDSASKKEHLHLPRLLLQRLSSFGTVINTAEHEFEVSSLQYFDDHLGFTGINALSKRLHHQKFPEAYLIHEDLHVSLRENFLPPFFI
ncbi:hypothetical protein HPB48_013674 [Haemaphysalis longicornis]|uniref:Uncharacterized protein n=1 Tax=Haemaphysalis longicornis TaxID=44386 RepID=A0A9J6GQJ1_HAELO|nr:hypothetical protein HPB48_013674 [Haemaphysalis longicornis]